MNRFPSLTTAIYWLFALALAVAAYFIIDFPRVFWGVLLLIYSAFMVNELFKDTEEGRE